MMKRSVFLSTFLFAAVLSPITLQPYTCGPPPAEARLAVLELRVGSFAGENTIEGFNPNVFSYDVRFPESESVGVLWVKTNHPSTSVDVEYDGLPVRLVGQSVAELDVPLGSSELTIHVARPGVVPDAKTYFVHIQRVPVFECTEQGIRDAIAYGGGPNYFDCDGPTHVPTAAEIAIDNDVILDGEGNMIVDAGGGGGAGGAGGAGGVGGAGFAAGEVAPKANGAHRVFSIPEGKTAELIGFTVSGGSTPDEGGGILNEGTLRLTSTTVTGNHADIGGGARNRETGTLIVTGSTVSQNTALRFAGGIHNRGQMEVVDSVISMNEAGQGSAGISNWPEVAIMTLTRTTVSGNVSARTGGGIGNSGLATLDQAIVSGNEAGEQGGGIYNRGTLTASDSTIESNSSGSDGGGLYNFEGALTLIGTTVAGNTAVEFGGGVWNSAGGSASLENTTVSFNSALYGGGIANREVSMALVGTTVYGNTATGLGGGIYNVAATLTMIDGEVSRNTALSSHGGGILNGAGASANLQNIRVSFNSAFNGGGISNDQLDTTMTLIGATVEENTATNDGGGINNGGTLRLVDSVVATNIADNIGGGIQSFSGSTELIGTTVSGNAATNGMGGGIHNAVQATLSLANSTVTGNTADDQGGGIHNVGSSTLVNSTVTGNTAEFGGGVRNFEGGTLIVRDSDVSLNTAVRFGAGIHNRGHAEVVNTMVSGNQAGDSGAGIVNWPETATMTVTRTTVTGNVTATFGGGMTNTGTATLTETTISGNEAALGGGGIENNGELVVRQSMVSANSTAEGGGGILNTETGGITLMTTTVTENAAGTRGGGIRNFGAMNIMDTTVSNNTGEGGRGISNRPGAWMALTNSSVSGHEGSGIANWSTLILASVTVSGNFIYNDGGSITARNTIVDSYCNATPLLDSLGGNIESPGNTCFVPHPADEVLVTPEQLGLGPLEDNLGPTWTHELLPGSVAIDSVDECVNAWGFPLLVDQRGAPRPHGPACDAGAFELGGVLLPRDQCVNDADRNAYESLSYINRNGYLLTCIDAAGEMATDCIFGSAQSSPSIVGCPAQAADVIACYPSCPPETIEAFGNCVASCTTEVTGLSAECAGCYGALAECAAQACLVECASAPYSQECDLCRGQSGCNMIYDACTGLPGNTDCPAVPDLCAGVDCDDGNQCTVGVCDPPTGECIIDNVPYGSLCDLGVGYGSCENGVCVPGG